MAEVMREGGGLHHVRLDPAEPPGEGPILVPKLFRQSPRDLRDFQGMGEPVVENVLLEPACHLGDVGEATERGGVEDPVAVALGGVPLIRRPVCVTSLVPVL
jgi:hypothetical protein